MIAAEVPAWSDDTSDVIVDSFDSGVSYSGFWGGGGGGQKKACFGERGRGGVKMENL